MEQENLILKGIFANIEHERIRQEQLKVEGRSEFTCADQSMNPLAALAVLTEEIGEVAKAVLVTEKLSQGTADDDNLRTELIQVAAVAVAWIEKLDRS